MNPQFYFLIAIGFIVLPAIAFFATIVRRSIDSACADDHRMTPQSPWFFYDRHMNSMRWQMRLGILMVIIAPAMVLAGVGIRSDWEAKDYVFGSWSAFIYVNNWLGGGLALVYLLAPKLKQTWVLTSVSFLAGFVFFYLTTEALVVFDLEMLISPFSGMAVLFLTCFYIRRIRGEAWFRLDRL